MGENKEVKGDISLGWRKGGTIYTVNYTVKISGDNSLVDTFAEEILGTTRSFGEDSQISYNAYSEPYTWFHNVWTGPETFAYSKDRPC